MLGLETQPGAMAVAVPALTLDRPVEKVARVELDPRLRRADFQHAPADRILEPRGIHELSLPATVDDPVVVITAPKPQLLIRSVDARPDPRRLVEIEWRTRHRRNLSGGNQGGVDRGERGRVEGQHVIGDAT